MYVISREASNSSIDIAKHISSNDWLQLDLSYKSNAFVSRIDINSLIVIEIRVKRNEKEIENNPQSNGKMIKRSVVGLVPIVMH